MAGIYIHIPYCKHACSYCNFHFSTQSDLVEKMVKAIQQELLLQKNFFNANTPLESIYFGGGTPSFIPTNHIIKLLDTIYQHYTIGETAEITLEANPDDINQDFISTIKNYTPINRISLGIQSFIEEDLQFMQRIHSVAQAKEAIRIIQEHGLSLTCDLIYGTPTLSNKNWEENILYLIQQQVPHFSCYALTVEEKTLLHHQIKTHKIEEINEEKVAEQFTLLQQISSEHNYEQYEISNFCLNQHYAIHNSNYWRNKPYLGVGPSAHSFDGEHRYWNSSNNNLYIKELMQHRLAQHCETLTNIDHYNEYILTNLRTNWGIDLQKIEKKFGAEIRKHTEFELQPFIDNGWLIKRATLCKLSDKGKLFCDFITEQLFWVDEEETTNN